MECINILQNLKDYDEAKVREATFVAGEYKCKDAIPFLVDLLQTDNIGLQEAAEISLRKINGPETVDALIPLLTHKDATIRNVAMDILRDIGSQNIDSLISLLESEDTDLRIFVADILGYIKSVIVVKPLCDLLLSDPDVNVRQQAAISLGKIGHPEAINCLKKALDDEEWVQFAVIEAFKKIKDPSSVQELLEFLGRGSEMVDSMIIETLGELGTVKVIPVLFSKLRVYPSFLRIKIVESIVKILGEQIKFTLSDKEKKEFLSFLREALEEDDEELQDIAIKGLEYLGLPEASKDILDKLLEIDEDVYSERYENIKRSLIRLGFNEPLKEAALNEDEDISLKAIDILIEMKDPKIKDFLKSIFWKKHRDIQRKISAYLLLVGDENEKDFFIEVLNKHIDGTVIKNSLSFFAKIHATKCDELILGFLDHRFPDVREKALEVCVSLRTPKIIERFIEFSKENDPVKKIIGITGLGKISDKKYEKFVVNGLKDKDSEIRKVAVEAIASIYKDDFPSILSYLKPFLIDPDPGVRMKVLELLYTYAPDLKKIIPILLDSLMDNDQWIIIKALEILGEIKEGFDVNNIISLLYSDNKLVKLKAIETLGNIGNHKAIQALLSLIKESKDYEIIEVIEQALDKAR